MDFRKLFFVLGLFVQGIIIVMMCILLKELRENQDIVSDGFQTATEELPFQEIAAPQKVEKEQSIQVPFAHFVTGQGKVFPSSDYVHVSCPMQGVIEDVYVTVGQQVQAGDALFKVDDSLLKCQLNEKESEVKTTLARFEKLNSGPSSFELKMKEREIQQVKAKQDIEQKEHDLLFALHTKNAITNSELLQQENLLKNTSAQLDRILAEYEHMKEGPSQIDQKVGQSMVEEKLANCKTIEKMIGDCSVKAPIEGKILSIDVHPGEYCHAAGKSALVMGTDDPLHLRVLIDQKEAWRITPSPHMRAIAVHRSNPKMQFVLEYVGVSPCFQEGKGHNEQPKMLEITFAFEKHKKPVYLDEILDVYIESSSPDDTAMLDYQFKRLSVR